MTGKWVVLAVGDYLAVLGPKNPSAFEYQSAAADAAVEMFAISMRAITLTLLCCLSASDSQTTEPNVTPYQFRGANAIIPIPTRQTITPITSHRSGRWLSTTQSQNSARVTYIPP